MNEPTPYVTPYLLMFAAAIERDNAFTTQAGRTEWLAGAIAALYGGSPGSNTPERFNQGYHWAQRYLEENPPPSKDAPSK